MYEAVDKEYIRILIIGGMIITFIGIMLSVFLLVSIALNFSYILPNIMVFLTLCVILIGVGLVFVSDALWRLVRPK